MKAGPSDFIVQPPPVTGLEFYVACSRGPRFRTLVLAGPRLCSSFHPVIYHEKQIGPGGPHFAKLFC